MKSNFKNMDALAALLLAERKAEPPSLTGSSTAGGPSTIATRVDRLPTPIGDEGDVLTVFDDAGDLVPAWKPAAVSFAEPDLDAISTARTSFVNTSGGNQTVTLPTAVGIQGRRYTMKKITGDANTATLATTAGQTIDGASTYVISAQWAAVTVQSDNANWLIVSELI